LFKSVLNPVLVF
jgi:large subunit ribosomal protein L14